jgi:5-formyltetrahydrofolate cyclo-ligase
VPLLAFDLYGQRLGMGGGFYDRYFAKSARRPKIIGIGYELQLAEHRLPTEPWDIALDAVVTENGARAFGAQLA